MSTTPLPNSDNDGYDPNVEAEDEELSSGNNRLALLLGGLLLLMVVGYVLLPKGKGSAVEAITPTFMLDDAAVKTTAPAASDSSAAGQPAAAPSPAAAVAPTVSEKAAAAPADNPVAPADAPASVAAAPAPAAAAPAPEPVAPEAPAPAPAPEPAAPSNVTLSGRITDENGQPLVGATVLLKGSSKATSTDASGNYALDVPNNADNTLVYGYGGYLDEEVRARGSQPVNVALTPSPNSKRRRR